MAIPLTYSMRNIIARKRSVAVTVVGVALSVMVYVVISATAAGIERVAVSSGEPDNVVILARGAATDDASRIPKNAVPVLSYLPEVARDSGGNPLASVEAKVTRPVPRVGSSATSGVKRPHQSAMASSAAASAAGSASNTAMSGQTARAVASAVPTSRPSRAAASFSAETTSALWSFATTIQGLSSDRAASAKCALPGAPP